MKNKYERMTKAELIKALHAAARQPRPPAPKAAALPYDRLVHELQVHQEELEAQNQVLREAQQLLEESRSRYAELYDLAPLGYVTLDGEGLIREINLTGAAMLGLERSRLIGVPFRRYVANDDKSVFREHLRRCQTETDLRATELHLNRNDGTTLYVELHSVPMRDSVRKTNGCLTVLTDIGERKHAQEQVRSEALFSEENPFPVLRVGREGTLEYANRAAGALLEQWQCRVGAPAPKHVRQAVTTVLDDGARREMETRVGESELSLVFVPIAERNYVNVYGRDVTEGKLANQQIRALNQNLNKWAADLEVANQELDSFSYSVSHDLRTPLATIEGFSRVLLEDYASQLPPEGRRYLDLIHGNALAMSRLIDDLLAFSRMSRQPLKKQTVLTGDLVREAMANLKSGQSDRLVEVVIGDLPPCQADPALLTQVWVNLLSNAFKFTTKCGNTRIEIGSFDKDDATVYFVKDNGVGFDMEQAGRLFGVFQRLHAEEDYPGTGVGLAIVERIVRRHGGRVWAEGEVGQGASFYFTLAGGGR